MSLPDSNPIHTPDTLTVGVPHPSWCTRCDMGQLGPNHPNVDDPRVVVMITHDSDPGWLAVGLTREDLLVVDAELGGMVILPGEALVTFLGGLTLDRAAAAGMADDIRTALAALDTTAN